MHVTVKKITNDKNKASNLTSLFVQPDTKLIDAVRKLDVNQEKIILVVDNSFRLLGTITDGDIRRALLKNLSYETPVREVMNKKPISLGLSYTNEEASNLIEKHKILHIPVLDDGKVVDLVMCSKILAPKRYNNPVVLMAGGMGKRLMPITENIPKPLVCVGGRPILETIISSLSGQGFSNIYLCVNYKAEMIKEHFGDGENFGVSIKYTDETKQLGTAGALGLIEDKFKEPFIVMNSDLLTKANFEQMMDFHNNHNSIATMGVRKYSYDVPFGVVNIENHQITNIVEKPKQDFFVNAGMYILSPEVMKFIPKNEYLDMPTLFTKLVEAGKLTVAFPVREYWLDIGQKEQLQQAERDYTNHFEE